MFYSNFEQWILVFMGYPKPGIHIFFNKINYTLSDNLILNLPYLPTSPLTSTPPPILILTSISNINSMTISNNLFSLTLLCFSKIKVMNIPKPVIHLFLKIIYYTLSVNLIFNLPYLPTSPPKSTLHPLLTLTSISSINSMTPLNNIFSLILFYPNVKKKFHFKTKVPFLCLPFIKKWI